MSALNARRDWPCNVTTYMCFGCKGEFVDKFTGDASLMARRCPDCNGVAVGGWNHARGDGTMWTGDEQWQREPARK